MKATQWKLQILYSKMFRLCIYLKYKCLICHKIIFYTRKNITTNRQFRISIISLICWANLSDFILCIWRYIKPKNTTNMFSIQKYIISQFSNVTTSSHYPQNTKNKSRQMHGTLTNNDIWVFESCVLFNLPYTFNCHP